MKIKVKYKGMTLRGNIVKKTTTFKCPDFKEELLEYTQVVNGKDTKISFTLTIESQIETWLEDLNTMHLIYDWDWQCIIDWSIVKIKEKKNTMLPVTYLSKKDQILGIAKVLLTENGVYYDFEVVYYDIRDSIKHLKVETQFHIVMNSMNTAMKAAIVAYKHIGKVIKGDFTEEEDKRYEILQNKNPVLKHRNFLK